MNDSDLNDDADFKASVDSICFPGIELIAAWAKRGGVSNASDFWDAFDKVVSARRLKRDWESWSDIC